MTEICPFNLLAGKAPNDEAASYHGHHGSGKELLLSKTVRCGTASSCDARLCLFSVNQSWWNALPEELFDRVGSWDGRGRVRVWILLSGPVRREQS